MKCLLVLKGLPGSGKSTLGRALAQKLGWALVDKDDIKDIIDGHSDGAGRLAYEVMFNIARRQLRVGNSAICDSPLTYEELYRQACRLAREEDASLAVVECVCPDVQEWQRRIEGRKELDLPEHHQTDWLRLQEYLASVEGKPDYSIDAPMLVLDSTRPLGILVQEVQAWVQGWGAG